MKSQVEELQNVIKGLEEALERGDITTNEYCSMYYSTYQKIKAVENNQ